MIFYSIHEITGIVKGKLLCCPVDSDYRISQIVTDSRTLLNTEDSVFFALPGVRNDGHLFIPELAERGVKVFVVSDTGKFLTPENVAVIEVDDTLTALQTLTAYHRCRFSLPVIGITGSNGKTVIKEWLHDLLTDEFSIVRNPKSYNSQIGVPLSAWLIQPGNNLGIFEAGISRPGEMEKLERIIRPAIGIFTNIGDAHQENFISVEQKVREKLLLFIGCRCLVYCTDQPLVAAEAYRFCNEHSIKPVAWSFRDNSVSIRFDVKTENGGTSVTAYYNDRQSLFHIQMSDFSSIENSCHCFAAILALGSDPAAFSGKFVRLAPLSMRLELKRGINNCLLLNDYYNSDINSLEIALSVLNHQAENNRLEKTVILSDIRQSGLSSKDLYGKVNKMLTDAGIDKIYGIGPEITRAAPLFTFKKQFYLSTSDFLSALKSLVFSQAAVLIKGARDFTFEDISSALQLKMHQTVLEINLNRLTDNLNVFKSLLLPRTKIMVMVKAFSYGSGDVEIARLLQFQRVDYLAVAVTDEGKDLRHAGITIPIIVMNPESHSFQQMIDFQLEPNLYSLPLAEEYAKAVDLNGVNSFPVHLKIDTGMNRLGLKSPDEVNQMILFLKNNSLLKVQSVFSHLAASDDPQMDIFTLGQISRFEELSSQIIQSLGYPVIRHILNSAGIERFRKYQYEMVRLGIGLYGISSSGLPLRPISRLRSTISQIKRVVPDETIGYNRAGKVDKISQIAVIPVGYADGFDRRLGNSRGIIFVNGRIARIVGNICMDMCMADVTGIDCHPGDEAEIFGENIRIQEVAEAAGTIPYEILTGISQRVKRIYLQE
jgi:Alr-MurF fusion protein